MKKLSLPGAMCTVCAALLLGACNSGGSYEAPPPSGGVITPPPAAVDAFYSTVTQYLAPTGEDTDATPINDAVVGTQPENSEPTEFG